MTVSEEFRCPHCDSYIGEGDFCFMRDGEVIGCENCIEHDTVELEDEEEIEADFYDSLYDEMKIERVFGI